MSSEQNKAIVRRALEEPWEGSLKVVDELFASDYIGHDPANPEPLRGPQGVKEFISVYRARDGERLANVCFRGGPPLGGPPVVWHADVPEASEGGR
jgi:hypothetical protein